MPNWCSNTMTLSHPDPLMMEKAAAAWNNGAFLNTLIPVPYELTLVGGAGVDIFKITNHEHHREMEKMVREINKKYFGFEDWYDWCIANWGTKWDIGRDSALDNDANIDGNSFTVSFDSAWAPPTAAYEKLEEMGYIVIAYYFEPGCDFCGKYAHGVDECCRIEDRTEEVDEIMGISETLASWEAQS